MSDNIFLDALGLPSGSENTHGQSPAEVTNQDFIDAVFKDKPDHTRVVVTGFAESPRVDNASKWGSKAVFSALPECIRADHNNYFATDSMLAGNEGDYRRATVNSYGTHVIVLDDVGPNGKVPAGSVSLTPSYVIETSPGNCQYGYLLERPCTDKGKMTDINRALAARQMSDPSGNNLARWVRMPVAINNKEEVEMANGGQPFKVALRYWNPGNRYGVDEVVQGLNLDQTPESSFGSTSTSTSTQSASSFENMVLAKQVGGFSEEQIWQALDVISPDADRSTWVEIGMALHHEYQGSMDGFEIYNKWSSRSATKYEGRDDCLKRWDSFRLTGERTPVRFASVIWRANKLRGEQAAAKQQEEMKAEVKGFRPGRLDPQFDPMALPRRQFVIGRRMQRKFLTLTVSPGGVSKSMFSLLTAVAIGTGRNLTGEDIKTQGKVWIINNEDDDEEIYRRLYGIGLRHGVPWPEIAENVHFNSGYNKKFLLAYKDENGAVVQTPFAETLRECIKSEGYVHVIFDPFVSIHTANENDNREVDNVASVVKSIAGECNVSIELIHHTRKGGNGGDSEQHAGDAEAGRGASALKDACRSAYTLARMSAATAEQHGIDWETTGRYLVRLDNAKANYAPPVANAKWFKLEHTVVPNGDDVGVHVPFDMDAVRAETAEAEAERREDDYQQWANDIGRELDRDVIRLNPLHERMRTIWMLQERATKDRIRAALRDPKLVTVDGTVYRLWIENGDGVTSPAHIHREVVEN